jgi:ribosomal protein S18 acetylase RimI-like enzyme
VTTCTIERMEGGDLVAMARCMAIDAEAFPYPSAQFGARADTARVWVARDDGRVLGFLAGRARRGELHVEGLAVDRAARRAGVGRSLLRTAIACAQDDGLLSIGLHVSVTSDPAIRLYRSEGFAVVRELPGFYPARAFGGVTDALAMSLRLAHP